MHKRGEGIDTGYEKFFIKFLIFNAPYMLICDSVLLFITSIDPSFFTPIPPLVQSTRHPPSPDILRTPGLVDVVLGRRGLHSTTKKNSSLPSPKFNPPPLCPMQSGPGGRCSSGKKRTSSRPPELSDRRWSVECDPGFLHWGIKLARLVLVSLGGRQFLPGQPSPPVLHPMSCIGRLGRKGFDTTKEKENLSPNTCLPLQFPRVIRHSHGMHTN